MNDEKERLEKELRFLKESLEANIISEEEYEKGKARIEKRLDEIGAEVKEKEEELTVGDISGVEEKEKETAADILKEVEEEEKEEEQEELVSKEEPEEEKPEPKAEPKVIKEEKKEEKEKPKKATKKPEKEEKPKPAKQKPEPETDEEGLKPMMINKNIFRVIAIIAIIIMLVIIMKRSPPGVTPVEEEFKPVCSTDEECIKTGKAGFCINPGTEEAVCEFQDPKEVGLTIINDMTCTGCDISKGLNFLAQLFPGISRTTIDANTPEGRSLINELGVKALPAYVLGPELNQTLKFDRSRNIFIHKNNKYLVKPSIGSNYFFTRLFKPSTLELFARPGEDTTKVDSSMNEVIDLFGNKITYKKHIVEKADEERLEREIAINKIYPTYLINNQLKFTGTQAPEIIKRRFCYMNNFPECETTLSLVVTN